MERSHGYSYPFGASGSSRYASNHASSSAFSASANPNEDWTKISDLAERRRIQNRIAQRNYRKKLKRRLEDLERRAASSSASPEQSHQELASNASDDNEKLQSPQSRRPSKNTARHIERRTSPETLSNDDRSSLFGQQITRQLSASPPLPFAFSNYPPTDASFFTGYPQNSSYSTMSNSYENYTYSNQYFHSLPPTLPPMLPSNGFKREHGFDEDDMLSPFSMTYASMAGINVTTTQAYPDHSAHTPPLTDPFSLDDSRESSPSNLAFPATPTSLPVSPAPPSYSIFRT